MTLLHVWLLNDRAGFRFHVSRARYLFLYRIFSQSVDFHSLMFSYTYALFILLFAQQMRVESAACAM